MSDLEWFNDKLKYYLDQKESRQYKHLIEEAIKSNDIRLKCDLHILLMHHSTQHFVEENLRKVIVELYLSDKNLDTYLDELISPNPKFGTISIHAPHRRDIELKHSLSIEVPEGNIETRKQYEDRVNGIKEVLRMILVEAKTIAP